VISGGEGAPWWAAGTLFAAWIAREIWSALSSRTRNRAETDANVELLGQLREGMNSMGERIKVMEEVQNKMSIRLEQEIQLRMTAQEEAHRLRLRVQTLESAMRGVGAVIPPDVGP